MMAEKICPKDGNWSQLKKPVEPKLTEPEGKDSGRRAGERGPINGEKLDSGVRGSGRCWKDQDGRQQILEIDKRRLLEPPGRVKASSAWEATFPTRNMVHCTSGPGHHGSNGTRRGKENQNSNWQSKKLRNGTGKDLELENIGYIVRSWRAWTTRMRHLSPRTFRF